MSSQTNELILRGGRVIDPARQIDASLDLLFRDGRLREIGPTLVPAPSARVQDVTGCIVTPGLIDLHTHVYWGGTSLGVDPIDLARRGATAVLVDAGSSGPANFAGFRAHVIEPSLPLKILPLLNLSFAGIFGFSRAVMVGESEDIRLLDLRECVRVVREHADLIVGIKVRVGRVASGTAGIAPLDMALEVAEEVGLPVMAHLDFPPPSRRDVVSRLRAGDILTHCFRPFPNAPSAPGGGVRQEILEARDRGVIFDIGHGGGSLGFATSRAMLDAGFKPDVISSDVHALSINGPAYHLLHTLAKFYALGMSLSDVIACATINPARALRQPELGSLEPGVATDASVFQVMRLPTDYADVMGETLEGAAAFQPRGLVLAGKWWN